MPGPASEDSCQGLCRGQPRRTRTGQPSPCWGHSTELQPLGDVSAGAQEEAGQKFPAGGTKGAGQALPAGPAGGRSPGDLSRLEAFGGADAVLYPSKTGRQNLGGFRGCCWPPPVAQLRAPCPAAPPCHRSDRCVAASRTPAGAGAGGEVAARARTRPESSHPAGNHRFVPFHGAGRAANTAARRSPVSDERLTPGNAGTGDPETPLPRRGGKAPRAPRTTQRRSPCCHELLPAPAAVSFPSATAGGASQGTRGKEARQKRGRHEGICRLLWAGAAATSTN